MYLLISSLGFAVTYIFCGMLVVSLIHVHFYQALSSLLGIVIFGGGSVYITLITETSQNWSLFFGLVLFVMIANSTDVKKTN